jgi:hydroxymethylpyrimidine/phosphomethylpyrimidine kinase
MCAITAITAQNTREVIAIEPVEPSVIVAQVRAVLDDIGVDAVKIGMLGTVETIAAVDHCLDLIGGVPVVLDPVMVAESGADLLVEEARASLTELILPRATVTTPNIPEARALTGLGEGASQEELAAAVVALGPAAAVVTGGHSEGLVDLLCDGSGTVSIEGPRHAATSAHGSGCTHSSALASFLALGMNPEQAARAARDVASQAVADGLDSIGSGPGPVDVFGLARGNRG